MDFGGPASKFHMRLCRAFKSFGMEYPMSFLLVGVIINTMALISDNPNFILDAQTVKDVLTPQEEIAMLCLFYDIKVPFRFESLKVVPTGMILDCHALRLDRSILVKKKNLPQKTLLDAQTLFNFLALVRYFSSDLGSTQVELLIADFNRKSLVYLPAHTIRRPGVGQRVGDNPFRPGTSNKRPISSGVWSDEDPTSQPAPMTEVSNTKSTPTSPRFNLFKSKPKKPRACKTSEPTRMDLDIENCPALLSDAPLRMRRKPRFGLGRF